MRAVPAHAKVNLALDVAGRRPDGFHDLVTVIAAIDWHDLVSVEVRAGEGRTRITVDGPTASAGMDAPGELLHRAAGALRGIADAMLGARRAAALDIDVAVHKRIPVAAGLGGGSADAAAVLRAGVAELAVDAVDLAPVAIALGSDIPFFLEGGIAQARGRGERLQPILGAPRLHLAVAVAGACSTAEVYAALTDVERSDTGRAARLTSMLARGATPEPEDYGSALEPAGRRVAPGFAHTLDALRAATGASWPMTGSGGAVFLPVPTRAAAAEAARAAQGLGLVARVCRTLSFGAPSRRPLSPPTTIAP